MKIEDLVEFKTRPLPPGRYYVNETQLRHYFIMTTQAIIYTRFSPRPNAKECTSSEKQANRCKAYCRQKGYIWMALYQDEKISGSVFSRPRLTAALTALKPGMVLVVDSSDRLARDMGVYYAILNEIEKADATIEFANGQPCEDTPEGKLIQGVFALLSAYERDRIRLRTKNGLAKKRENGERTTGKIPIGWMIDPEDPKRLVVCVHERDAIIRACYGASEGWTSGKIAVDLNCGQYGCCRLKPWSPRTIRKLIKRHSFWAGPDGDLSLEPKHP